KRKVKSVLCIPLQFQGKSKGIIYLENNDIPSVFTKDRLELLKHLSSQIVISIDNALIYENLEKKVVERTNDLNRKNIELEQVVEKLDLLATTDALTGLNNRRSFDDYLEKEYSRLIRTNKPLSLIICDIDFFKPYNDNYGHQKGDETLSKVAQVLSSSSIRSGDLVARYGGEEFAIILPQTDEYGAMQITDNIHKNLKQLKLSHEKSNTSKYVTVSIGIAVIKNMPNSVSEIIKIADDALYKAKGTGRNNTQYTIY
ncbi:MAG: diguanylate cyclase (GGDEF)-like protein, partial [Sulfurimonas sp.]|uniref:sensor domain-containing diguanylate cyclase n=1 Tax=Sulfurimonas sp. TaxID=2022749 RepID=UPI0039E31AC0